MLEAKKLADEKSQEAKRAQETLALANEKLSMKLDENLILANEAIEWTENCRRLKK